MSRSRSVTEARQQDQEPLLSSREVGNDGTSPAGYGGVAGEQSADSPSDSCWSQLPSSPAGSSRTLNTLSAYAIVVSIVIGSGVFTSPGAIDANVPSPGVALCVWLVGGALAWSGATILAELGTALPDEPGGVQPFLVRAWKSELMGFLAAWTWVVAVMPATLAILSIVFVDSLEVAVTGSGAPPAVGGLFWNDEAGRGASPSGLLRQKMAAIVVLFLVSGANCISTRTTTRLNGLFVVTKFASVAAVFVAGVAVAVIQFAHPDRTDVGGRDWFVRPWFRARDTVNPDGSITRWGELGTWDVLGRLSTALYGALWAYCGWDKAIYITAELSAPARQLPLAINTALPTTIVCFLAANAAYYVLLPWNFISTTDSAAVTAIGRLLGDAAGIAAASLVCVVVAGSLLGNSFVASRMVVAAAGKSWLPGFLGVVGRVGFLPFDDDSLRSDESHDDEGNDGSHKPKRDAPVNAIILTTATAAIYIWFGNFRALLTFNGLGEYSFFFLTVLGAIILRFREADLPRPFKPPIAVAVLFALVSGFVVIRGATFAPVQAVILVVLWLHGLLFYWARSRFFG